MSRLIVPQVRSRAVILDEVDERVAGIAEALNGGLDRDNLAPTYRLPAAQFMEGYAPFVLVGMIPAGKGRADLGVIPATLDHVIVPRRIVVVARSSVDLTGTIVSLAIGVHAPPAYLRGILLGQVQMASGASRLYTGQSGDLSAGGWGTLPAGRFWFKVTSGSLPDGPVTMALYGKIPHRS